MDLLDAWASSTRTSDEADGRCWPAYGMIVDVDDPNDQGRVAVRLFGQAGNESTDWFLPLWPGSIEGIPRVGEPVCAIFVDGVPARGFYAVHPKSTTTGRASEHAVLGDSAWALLNHLIDLVNELRGDFIAHQHLVPGVAAGAVTVASNVTTTIVTAVAAGKGKAADGSVIASNSADATVLSGEVKLR